MAGSRPQRKSVAVSKRQSMLEERQGYLQKKSSKSRFGISLWQKRYFVLAKGKLLVFANEQEYLHSLN
jgi:hypothetical protein